MPYKDKRDLNRNQRTGFANSGRSAGMGILYERYDEESGAPQYCAERYTKLEQYSKEEWKEKIKPQPVKTYRLSKEEIEKL